MKKRTILNLILLISLVAIPSASMAGVMGSILGTTPVDPTVTSYKCGVKADVSCGVVDTSPSGDGTGYSCQATKSVIVPCAPPTVEADGTVTCYAGGQTKLVNRCITGGVDLPCPSESVNANCQLITTKKCPCACNFELDLDSIPTIIPDLGFPVIWPDRACPEGLAHGQPCTAGDLDGNLYRGSVVCH